MKWYVEAFGTLGGYVSGVLGSMVFGVLGLLYMPHPPTWFQICWVALGYTGGAIAYGTLREKRGGEVKKPPE